MVAWSSGIRRDAGLMVVHSAPTARRVFTGALSPDFAALHPGLLSIGPSGTGERGCLVFRDGNGGLQGKRDEKRRFACNAGSWAASDLHSGIVGEGGMTRRQEVPSKGIYWRRGVN